MVNSLKFHKSHIIACLCIAAFSVFASCKPHSQQISGFEANENLKSSISEYVTCTSDTINMLLASADSICQLVDTCSLEFLDLNNDEVNKYLVSLHKEEIPTILKLYASYDVVTQFPTDEANGAFAWHEIASTLIAEHYGKKQVDIADVDTIFNVIDGILGSYAAGSQYDMNISAWRWVMLSDYRLIDAYKKLYRSCNEPSLLKSVHKSYINFLEMYRNRCNQIEDSYSDLPRELACMQIAMMDDKRKEIESLTIQFTQGKTSVQDIRLKLEKIPVDNDDWNIYDY